MGAISAVGNAITGAVGDIGKTVGDVLGAVTNNPVPALVAAATLQPELLAAAAPAAVADVAAAAAPAAVASGALDTAAFEGLTAADVLPNVANVVGPDALASANAIGAANAISDAAAYNAVPASTYQAMTPLTMSQVMSGLGTANQALGAVRTVNSLLNPQSSTITPSGSGYGTYGGYSVPNSFGGNAPTGLSGGASQLAGVPSLSNPKFRMMQLHQLQPSILPELQQVLAERGMNIPPNLQKQMPPEIQSPVTEVNPLQIASLSQEEGIQAKRGGLIHHEKIEGEHPEFITGHTGHYVQGRGTGQSDDIPAVLHEGDYVIDADTVAALGDGSSKAGGGALEQFRRSLPVQKSEGGKTVPAKIADGEYVLPEAFVTALGQGSNKHGAKLLDGMRKAVRTHKRAAPDTKIPPKAKSPLEYMEEAMKG